LGNGSKFFEVSLKENGEDVRAFFDERVREIEIGDGKMSFCLFQGVVEKDISRILLKRN